MACRTWARAVCFSTLLTLKAFLPEIAHFFGSPSGMPLNACSQFSWSMLTSLLTCILLDTFVYDYSGP